MAGTSNSLVSTRTVGMVKNREAKNSAPLICSPPSQGPMFFVAFSARQQPLPVCRSLSRTRPAANRPSRVHRFVRALRTIHKHGGGSLFEFRRSLVYHA